MSDFTEKELNTPIFSSNEISNVLKELQENINSGKPVLDSLLFMSEKLGEKTRTKLLNIRK